jgi:hypothetical protein
MPTTSVGRRSLTPARATPRGLLITASDERSGSTGQLTDERTLTVHRSLGWTQAEGREGKRIQPGQILEIVRGPDKGRYWTVTGVGRGRVMAVDVRGERPAVIWTPTRRPF